MILRFAFYYESFVSRLFTILLEYKRSENIFRMMQKTSLPLVISFDQDFHKILNNHLLQIYTKTSCQIS